MKNAAAFVIISLLFWGLSSCGKYTSTHLGGDTEITISEVGNEFTFDASSSNGGANIQASCEIISREDGIVTAEIEADLSDPDFEFINDLIPANLKDNDGKLNTDFKCKITSDGVQDFANIDEDAFTLVKYNAKVGDTYKLKKSDGKTITRTVTERTDEDDFYYDFMLIKTIEVEQDSRVPGISKFVYRFNHKFGLVHVKVVADDGSEYRTYVHAQNF